MAANFSEIGINFTVFEDISFEGFNNLTNQTAKEFIANVPVIANTVTDGYYGIVVLIVLGIFLLQMLTDISQFGLFRYSTVRAFAITLGIMTTFGIMMVSVGFMTNFIHLTIISTLYIMFLVYILLNNPT